MLYRYFLLVAVLMSACQRAQVQPAHPESHFLHEGIWTLKDIPWDTDMMLDDEDTLISVYTTLPNLYFSPDGRFKYISFIAYRGFGNDSVFAGAEPSRRVQLGSWHLDDTLLVIDHRLVWADIKHIDESIPGPVMHDTLLIDPVLDTLKLWGYVYSRSRTACFDTATVNEVMYFSPTNQY